MAEYIVYQYINSTNIYSSIVGRKYPIYIDSTYIYSPIVSRIYPIPIYKIQQMCIPQLLAEYIQYQLTYFPLHICIQIYRFNFTYIPQLLA